MIRKFWGPNRSASKSRAWMIHLSKPFYVIDIPGGLKIDANHIGSIVEYRSAPPIQFITPTRNPFSNTLHARFR